MSRFLTRHGAIIIGLGIGLALGLVYTWVVNPVELVNTYPALMRSDYRREWVRLAALSYAADGDIQRVRTRLDGLEQEDIAKVIPGLIEEYAAAGHSAKTLRSLAFLAQMMDVHTPAMLVYLGTPPSLSPTSAHTPSPTPTPSRTPTPTPTPTARPTRSPSPTPRPTTPPPPPVSPTPQPTDTPRSPTPTPSLLARLRVTEQEQICQQGQDQHIEVVIKDERGRGVAGVEVWLMWSGGADRAVTGLKPQKGAGYADFHAEWGIDYSLGIGELGRALVTDLRLEPCPLEADRKPMVGSWHLVLEPRSVQNN
jgi:hypothetical protein